MWLGMSRSTTKIEAKASKHKAMSYERMKKLRAEVDRWLAASGPRMKKTTSCTSEDEKLPEPHRGIDGYIAIGRRQSGNRYVAVVSIEDPLVNALGQHERRGGLRRVDPAPEGGAAVLGG